MGIYIKGMKMPKDDETIRFVKLLNGKIVAVTSPIKGVDNIHEIIEVTEPHGDLIDRDAIPIYRYDFENGDLVHRIDDVPVVIEAEGE